MKNSGTSLGGDRHPRYHFQFGPRLAQKTRSASMKMAKELMLDFTALAFRDPQKAADMFTEDGAFEMPYLATFGYASRYKGREAIADFFQLVCDVYSYL